MSNTIKKIVPLGFPWATQDPFIFCVYHQDDLPAGDERMRVRPQDLRGRTMGNDFVKKNGWRMYHGREIPGFPYHPHRGFETITINTYGAVDHFDSLGAAGRFRDGDVQWMTAGRGVLHSEMFPLLNTDKPNPLEIFQIWLNLPARSKLTDPHFKMLWREDIPMILEGGITVKIIAGNMLDTQASAPTPASWAADPDNAVGVYVIAMKAGAKRSIPGTNPKANRTLYFFEGKEVSIDGQIVSVGHLIGLEAANEFLLENGPADARFLMLEGKPIGEPVAQHGPFVMNTAQEIQEAFAEFRRTQFGGWPWPQAEQAHPREKARFALHSDGRLESKIWP